MALNVWTQPSGFSLGTLAEGVHVDIALPVTDAMGVSFSIITGALPAGMFLIGDTVSGSPFADNNVVGYSFCIRASSGVGFSDRTFQLSIASVAQPEFITPAGELAAGVHKQFYVLDGSFVSYQIVAVDMNPEAGQTLSFFIENGSEMLPPGLTLSSTGLISGFVGPALASPSGEPHDFTRTYAFTVTVTDGINFSQRTFEIFVADPDAFRADSLLTDAFAGRFTSDASFLQQPVWRTDSNLGIKRANNYITIPLALYDSGSTTFRLESTNVEVYATTFQYANTDNALGRNTLTVTNVNGTIVAGQYLTFANYVDGADDTVYRIYSVTSLGGGVFRMVLTSNLTMSLDNGQPFYIGSRSTLPPGMSFDDVTSEIYGRVPYQPAITTSYEFTITATRTYVGSNEIVTSARTFNIRLLGDITSQITWTTPADLGSLAANYTSTLAVSASSNVSNTILVYALSDGSLPPGLTLSGDGELVGMVNQYYNAVTGEDGLITFDGNTIFDSGTTTFDRSFTFTVQVNDQFLYSAESRQFTVAITTPNTVPFSDVVSRPLLATDQRAYWRSFITDTTVFTPSSLYRANDPKFGMQSNLEMMIFAGIETNTASAYVNAIMDGFKRKRFQFSSFSKAIARDSITGDTVYEVVYVKMFDPLVPTSGAAPETVTINGTTYMPNSISNWRRRVGATGIGERRYLPLWMRTIQPGHKTEQDYTLAIPLCYCKAGEADAILTNIKHSSFDFRKIDYTIDRVIINSVTGSIGDKYFAFNNDRTTV